MAHERRSVKPPRDPGKQTVLILVRVHDVRRPPRTAHSEPRKSRSDIRVRDRSIEYVRTRTTRWQMRRIFLEIPACHVGKRDRMAFPLPGRGRRRAG